MRSEVEGCRYREDKGVETRRVLAVEVEGLRVESIGWSRDK